MALESIPPIGFALAKLIRSFRAWTFITVQVVGPNTLYLAGTQQQLAQPDDDGSIDGLQLTQLGAPGGMYQFWRIGDLYVAGSQAPGVSFRAFFDLEGPTTSSDLGPTLGGQPPVYGVVPTIGLVNR